MKFDSHPEIATERLILSKVLASDIPRIVEYANNKNIRDNTLNMPYPYVEKDAIFWINLANQGFENGDAYIFAIRQKTDLKFIGGVGLKIVPRFNRGELGYWLGEPFWNNGFVSEAISALIDFGFHEVGLNKIFATHILENPASGKVMIKNGMILEGELKEHFTSGDRYTTVRQYRLTKEEYEGLNRLK